MLGIKIKLYNSKYFVQNNAEVKNNLHPLSLQQRPTKDGLLSIKFLKLSCRGTEPNSWLPTSSRAFLFPRKRGFVFV